MILRQIQCFRIKRCLVRLYPQLFVGGRVSYLHYFCLFAHSGVQYISCCSFCLTSSCVPNVASFSGVSFFDCPFGILQRLFKPKQHYESERYLYVCKWYRCLPCSCRIFGTILTVWFYFVFHPISSSALLHVHTQTI
jgi:hypothetical protein